MRRLQTLVSQLNRHCPPGFFTEWASSVRAKHGRMEMMIDTIDDKVASMDGDHGQHHDQA
eukprot:6799820-Prorocentrum_lima.AAC.1